MIIMSNESIKQKLLNHYSTAEVREYIQLDAYHEDGENVDDIFPSDQDGDTVIFGTTKELRHTDLDVRIHISQHTSKTDAIRLIEKILNSYRKDPDNNWQFPAVNP